MTIALLIILAAALVWLHAVLGQLQRLKEECRGFREAIEKTEAMLPPSEKKDMLFSVLGLYVKTIGREIE